MNAHKGGDSRRSSSSSPGDPELGQEGYRVSQKVAVRPCLSDKIENLLPQVVVAERHELVVHLNRAVACIFILLLILFYIYTVSRAFYLNIL